MVMRMSGVAGYLVLIRMVHRAWAVRIPTWTDLGGNFTDYQGRRPDGEVGLMDFMKDLRTGYLI